MTPREERGLIIAALCKLSRQDGMWLVPSQTAAEKKYVVKMNQGMTASALILSERMVA